MAQKVLIMGESGTGKSTSLRNCDPATTAVINPVGKPLPFKNHFEMLNNETDARKIVKYMKEQCAAGKKLLVVDDFQYILAVPYMNRIKETGWDKYNDFGANYFEIIDCCKDLPDDVVVVYMTHLETLDNGLTTVKLIGKLLREKITIEGLFGLTADIKLGTRSSYEVIKIDGEERFIEWDIEEGGTYQEVPKWLFPVRTAVDFLDMDAGDGRNQALFNYILTLTSNDFSVDDTRECIRILNRFVLKEPLSDDELEVILRDEAFQKPVFFCDKTFLFDRFATWLKNNENVVSISNQLHIYQDGIYQVGYKAIETAMINQIPNLKKTQRREVLEYVVTTANEQLIMDTNNVNTARKVWRWNLNGLGYSSTGYNGTYKTAITMDGQITERC